MAKFSKIVICTLALLIVVSFFLPWVRVESQQVGTFSKLLTGKRQQAIDEISGLEIPILANSDESRLIISIAKIFNPGIKDVDKKSFLVLIVPILAIIIFLVKLYLKKNVVVDLLFAVIGIALFAFAFYKITSTDLDKLVLQIKIGLGMWITLYSYLGIGILSAVCFLKSLAGKK
jgi:hypothetical protein